MSKYTNRGDWDNGQDRSWNKDVTRSWDMDMDQERDWDMDRHREWDMNHDRDWYGSSSRDRIDNRDRTEERSYGRQKKARKRGLIILIIIVAALLVAAAVALFIMKTSKPESKVDILRTNIEAAEMVDLGEFVVVKDKYAEDYVVTVAGDQKRKFMEVGETPVEYTLANEKKSETFSVTFTVEDTTPPVIKVQNDNVDKDADFDITKAVSANDSLDGKLPASSITYEGTVDTSTVGSYDITVTAVDAAGNEATRNVKIKIAQPQGDAEEFFKQMTGLFLNGCKDSVTAEKIAKMTGLTDVSMTEFYISDGKFYMSTLGDVNGEYDGDVVPDISNGEVKLSYVSTDLMKARGTASGMRIEIDLNGIDDGVIYFKCGENTTYCARTGFDSEKAMTEYLETKYQ